MALIYEKMNLRHFNGIHKHLLSIKLSGVTTTGAPSSGEKNEVHLQQYNVPHVWLTEPMLV